MSAKVDPPLESLRQIEKLQSHQKYYRGYSKGFTPSVAKEAEKNIVFIFVKDEFPEILVYSDTDVANHYIFSMALQDAIKKQTTPLTYRRRNQD